MPKRRTDRPIEKLSTAWTSTSDLEASMAMIFKPPPKSQDNLTGGSRDLPAANLHVDDVSNQRFITTEKHAVQDSVDDSSDLNLSRGTQGSLTTGTGRGSSARRTAGEEQFPAPNRTGGLYLRLDGGIVDGRCIRPYGNAQSAHTASEHLVYTTMWKMLGAARQDAPSREGLLPLKAVARKAALSVRNLRRVVRSLEEKLALEITAYEDKPHSIPRRYRVWGSQAILDRRRQAGYDFIYRNRNLTTLAKPYVPPAVTPPDNLTGRHRTR